MSRDRPVPAGLCVALTAIKPHLLFAFGLYLLLEALVSRRDRIALLTGTIAVVATAVAAWQINPTVYADYFAALSAPPGTTGFVSVQDWRLPLGSYWLRMSVAPDQFWVQFLPTAVVTVGTDHLLAEGAGQPRLASRHAGARAGVAARGPVRRLDVRPGAYYLSRSCTS